MTLAKQTCNKPTQPKNHPTLDTPNSEQAKGSVTQVNIRQETSLCLRKKLMAAW